MPAVNEDAVQAALRELATARASLTALLPVESMRDEFPIVDAPLPRLGFHLGDMTPIHNDNGKAGWWDCYFGIGFEANTSAELRAIKDELVACYDGVPLVVPGHRTQGVRVDRVSGTTYDPETQKRGRVLSLRVLVQPGD